ncbi:polyketide synthase dehydratase domain-containing protein [Hirsutella rhossiliensis]|uniref:Polyketide synthase dehydratase domain-containing protein n=1 Tax=Hirsutella rhossiliensis TaxID=111463 RepID=A0A9P8MSY2_9HYPO|nr:polyketide synthase dehydratase domain-containing protein [Hirsutella rhossiliensis]KAH0960594.1 polyketide synthase dehydratase domain-containing protein [Hirsutella rhossiliensis]
MSTRARSNEPIAIIGGGCRFPGGASSPSKLWDLLRNPRDLVKRIPKDRFNVDAFYHPDASFHGRTNARYGYFLDEDPYAFDAGFFNIPPTEAETVDPQQRLLLETVYDSITAAGLKLEDLRGSPTAVYVGLMQRDFLDSQNYDLDALNTYAATGTAASILSSLVAVHHAVEQLRTGLSKVAVAAGSNLMLGPVPFISASKLNMFSPTGRSRMWDAGADGYARGEGVAAIVMKTLTQAIADGDVIECIIRESGVNQDGKTAGITMPNASAQEALIRQVYERAGLDINRREDRCQYFEAHGTGTPAGDPQEAKAISSAFFGQRPRAEDEEPLYVGSIKTVIGHTEGTAGIAGVIKASHIIQHGLLVPNMLLDELSPRVAPFCSDLRIVTKQQQWPALKCNQPRRVSVNSFGFGGTNAHVILESYSPCSTYQGKTPGELSTPCLAPITLSANSEASLRASMESLGQCLKNHPDIQLRDLAWTLLKKRSNLQVRHTIQAKTVQGVCEAIERDAPLMQGNQTIATSSDVKMTPQVLGVFTGQGAQWPAMGKALIMQIPYARAVVSELDQSLQLLPADYRPTWKLIDQLFLEGDASNVHDATYSQPLCCAVQIVLTKLIQASGVRFKVVVGHSSGEIACAFAAGYISASQAIRIAYLRGLTSKHAGTPNGAEGAMLAAGTSFDDASELCGLEAFEGRITVAASNAPESVTLSGDKDAILEAQVTLNDEGKFNRILKVNKAYHSHHMRPCAEPYVTALKACGCDVFAMDAAPTSIWISSVSEGKVMKPEDLKAEYWADNLLSPVLFSFAVEQALVKHTPLDIGVEVGAHPALKNPSIQTIENCAGAPIPYVGCMERDKDDTEAFSSCLGYLWSRFGSAAIDVDSLYSTLSLDARDLSKELPSYSWDHSRTYRKESRTLRSWLAAERPHPLLGKQLAHSSPSSVQWQNFIRQRDIEWLDGHSLQGQTVFPGAGYVVMAMEAAMKLAGDREVQLLEVLNLSIDKAVTFEDENSLVEVNLTLSIDASQTTDDYAVYGFTINSCLARETGLSISAAGLVAVTYGPGSLETLPAPQLEPPHLNKVSIDRFYNMLDEIGYGYRKQFRGVSSLRRGDSKACGTINYHRLEDNHRNMVLHPATLDVAFQSFIGAYTAPGDRRLRSLLVPTGISRIALNPWVSDKLHALSSQVNFISTCAASARNSVEGDIEVFDAETDATMLHIEGLSFKPFSPPSATDDHEMFSKWDWGQLYPEALLDDRRYHATEQDMEDVKVIERITYWYIKSFLDGVTDEDRQNASFTFTKQIQWCEHTLAEAKAGRNVWYEAEWDKDTRAGIEEMIRQNASHPFVRLIQRVGEGAVETLRENKNAFDLMDHDGLLTEFYGGTVSYGHSYNYYQTMLEQINHRYQNLDVLEIGAGTGGASRYFLNDDKLSFNSYTFTDISSAFFEQAASEFERHVEKMDFRPLDVRRDPTEQEFKPHSYDLIIASNVLHATPRLEETLKNVRTLLKPGGRLIVIEVVHREHTRIGFIFGLFADWWAGHDEGRTLEPFISYDQWDVLLKKTGFSGIDGRTLDPNSRIFPNGVFHTHAVDNLVSRLDSPLTAPVKEPYAPLVVIGGSSPKTAELVDKLSGVLPARKLDSISCIKEIIDFDYQPGSTFIVLSEMDKHTFAELDDEQLDALQTLLNAASNILWVTEDAWVENPQQAMTIGFLRTLRMEYPDVNIQVVNVDKAENVKPEFLIETALRLEDGANWQDGGILWTQEPELFLSGDKVIVPRLRPDVPKNNRLNAVRRPILIDADPRRETLSVEYDGDELFFKVLEERFIPSAVDESLVKVRVQFSLAKALRIGQLGYFNLLQGRIAGSEDTVVALSGVNASSVRVPSSRLVTVSNREEASLLPAISADLFAQTLVSDLAPGSSLLVFDPPSFYAEALIRRAAASSVTLTFASNKPSPKARGIHWVQLHEKETQRGLCQKLPRNPSVFYDLTGDRNPASLSNRLARCLPGSCSIRRVDNLFQNVAAPFAPETSRKASALLADAIGATDKLTTTAHDAPVLQGQKMASSKGAVGINTIIDWRSDQIIPSRVRSIETDQTFVDTKTYLLVGLAGDLGRSIARFMVEHGARHVVLTSRSPKIDQRWIDEMSQIGGNVMVLAMDVSNEASVDAGLAQVRASMPSIGGVAFGPLVLQDVMFKNMDLSMLEMVLAPKVTGARLLNERLSDPANPLDFFVMFSSFVMVSGNPGQAAYSAANAYTHAIAQQRRAHGMAGSTIDIGAVFGVGFIARAGREHEYDVVKFIFDEVNEWELHALFAEAVVAGRNRAIKDVEVITGMPYMDPVNRDRIPYFDDPRFAYFKLSDRKARGDDAAGAAGSIKDRLLQADGIQEVREIIIDGLSSRICGALQLASADELNLITPLIDLGVDSLSAVTIGSWFSKNLSIDIPLLKILGGASVNDLADEAVSRLTPEAIPLAHSGAAHPSGEAQPASALPAESTADATSSVDYDDVPTPASSLEEEFSERKAPLSIAQEYAWKQQQLPLDPKTFNSTIGMYMQGPLNLNRLAWAFNQALLRNDAFRTSFIPDRDDSGNPIQFVMKTPHAKFEAVHVADKAAADQGFKDLEGYQYDLAKGDTLKIVNFHWSPTDHLLVIAYHRLVGDGWTTEHLFVEAGQLYSGAQLQPAPSYADFAIRQRKHLEAGEFDKDLDYWSDLFRSFPARLPVLVVPGAKANVVPTWWTEHGVTARLNRMVAIRIKDRSRKHKVTPMHYYLAAFHVLLARLTSSTNIVIGVADTNRPTLVDQATMGYFSSLLPVRLDYASDKIFNEVLLAAKEQLRLALLHSAVPYGAILDRLGLANPTADKAPLFQAVFDYKQGQAESGNIGEAKIVDSRTPRAGSPYDITLEMSNDPTKDPLITIKLQSERYQSEDADVVMNAYLSILSIFSRNPALRVEDGRLDQGAKARA